MKTNRSLTQRKGNTLVFCAFLMVVFLVGAAFCVDIAYMHMVKAELRTAVDAASRAGTEALARTQDPGVAVDTALSIAEQNSVAGNGLTLNRSDVVLGQAVAGDDGRFDFSAGGDALNSVNVIGRREAGAPDGAVSLFFGNVLGTDTFEPVISSVSASSVRDIALVLDRSGSMNRPAGPVTRIEALVDAVNVFLTEIEDSSPNSNVSLTTYSTASTRDIPLTDNFASITSQVNALPADGFTNIFQGLRQGSDSLETDPNTRPFAEKTVIVMTDGNFNVGGTPLPSAQLAAQRGQTIHTITFSSGANQAIMQDVAQIGGGLHIHADDAGSLVDAFREIARTLNIVLIE